MKERIISEINIYPIKSCAGISLEKSRVEKIGLENDRRWMVVNENGMFLTQRDHPRMCLISAVVVEKGIVLQAPGKKKLSVPRTGSPGNTIHVEVWEDMVDAIDQGNLAAQWLSEFMETKVRLVHFPEATSRKINSEYSRPEDVVSFADKYPLLLISQASLDDLNSRLPDPLPMNRFRPNLVVTGTEPYEEDRWKIFEVGGIQFEVVKPCLRCVITTTDQTTGERGVEPLRTLAAYRRFGNGVAFGQNVIPRGIGVVQRGSAVTIIS